MHRPAPLAASAHVRARATTLPSTFATFGSAQMLTIGGCLVATLKYSRIVVRRFRLPRAHATSGAFFNGFGYFQTKQFRDRGLSSRRAQRNTARLSEDETRPLTAESLDDLLEGDEGASKVKSLSLVDGARMFRRGTPARPPAALPPRTICLPAGLATIANTGCSRRSPRPNALRPLNRRLAHRPRPSLERRRLLFGQGETSPTAATRREARAGAVDAVRDAARTLLPARRRRCQGTASEEVPLTLFREPL